MFTGLQQYRALGNETKTDTLSACVFSSLLYTAEMQTVNAAGIRKVLAFKMRRYRRILKVSWQGKVSNRASGREMTVTQL